MQLGGKHQRQQPVTTYVAHAHLSGRLYFITYSKSKTKFLVDTGAAMSVILPTPTHRRKGRTCQYLYATNRMSIPTYGKRFFQPQPGFMKRFPIDLHRY